MNEKVDRLIRVALLLLSSSLAIGCGRDEKAEVEVSSAEILRPITPRVLIDWRMQDRTLPEPPGTIVPLPADKSFIHPSSWHVTLDGCATVTSAAPLLWKWSLFYPTGLVQTEVRRGQCTVEMEVLRLGDFPVQLTVDTVDGNSVTGTRTISLRDFLIVSIGDSIASGEGNPDIPAIPGGGFRNPGRWADRGCHRSWNSGPARAAIALEQADPRTSVTFISVACSGATVDRGLLNPYEGIEPQPDFQYPAQVDQVADLVNDGFFQRDIDALLIQIGANDLGFASFVRLCADPTTNPCYDEVAADPIRIRDGIQALQEYWYPELASALGALSVRAAYLTEYPDATHDQNGDACDIVLEDAGLGFIAGDISPRESRWAYGTIILPLQSVVARAAAGQGWNLIDGITDSFYGHGACSSESWLRGYQESLAINGNESGFLHPNASGQAFYGDRIFQALRPALAAAAASPR